MNTGSERAWTASRLERAEQVQERKAGALELSTTSRLISRRGASQAALGERLASRLRVLGLDVVEVRQVLAEVLFRARRGGRIGTACRGSVKRQGAAGRGAAARHGPGPGESNVKRRDRVEPISERVERGRLGKQHEEAVKGAQEVGVLLVLGLQELQAEVFGGGGPGAKSSRVGPAPAGAAAHE